MGQILSVTTDNGKNMLKTSALLDAHYRENLELRSENDNEVDNEDSDIEIDDDIFDDEYYLDLLNDIRSRFDDILHTDLIHGISCAAHCLHLVVTHGIKNCPDVSTLIEKCRGLSVKLRTPTFRAMIELGNFKNAVLDVTTRWSSIYFMVLHLPIFYSNT